MLCLTEDKPPDLEKPGSSDTDAPLELGTYVDPMSDFGWKLLFGHLSDGKALLGLMNALFAGERKIVALQYLNTDRLGETVKNRAAIFDIYCNDERESLYN